MAEQDIRPRNFTDTATDSDLQNADNYLWLDTADKAKKMPITKLAVVGDTAATESDLVAGSALPIMTANGPKSLPGNTIAKASEQAALTTYAQNVAHSIAPEYDGTTGAVAGHEYMHEGIMYLCKENTSGDWNSSKFVRKDSAEYFDFLKFATLEKFDLNDKSHWLYGGYNTTTGELSTLYDDRLCTQKYYFTEESYADLTLESGVTAKVYLYGWDKDGNYCGDARRVDNVTQAYKTIEFYKSLHPSAILFSFSLVEISGTAVSVDNLDGIGEFSDTLTGLKLALNDDFENNYKQLLQVIKTPINLNDKSFWRFGGYDTATGNYNAGYTNRLCSNKRFDVDKNEIITFTKKTGISATFYMYAWDKSGAYLGQKATTSVPLLLSDYPTTQYVAFSLVNVSGTTVSVDNLHNICTMSSIKVYYDGFLESLDDRIKYASQVYALPRNVVPKLKVATKKPCVSFIFDDATENDALIVDLFDKKEITCGFAYIANQQSIESEKATKYLKYQSRGYEILNHSIDGKVYNTTNYPTRKDAIVAMQTAVTNLSNDGFVVNGFVAPSSSFETSYKPIIGELHAFGFVEIANASNHNTPSTPVTNLHRLSLQSANSLQDIKDYLDAAIANSEMVVFYGHSASLDNDGDFTLSKISDVIDYVLAKRADELCHVGTPTEMVREYYEL